MKNKLGLIIGAFAITVAAGCSSLSSNAEEAAAPIVPAKEVQQATEQSTELNEGLLSVEEAKQIALEEFDGKVVEFELDEDDDRLVYEIELKNEEEEAEIEIHAITGEIIELDIERDDDRWDD